MCQWALAVTPESSACGVKSELCCDSREIASNVEIMYSPQIHAFFFFFFSVILHSALGAETAPGASTSAG